MQLLINVPDEQMGLISRKLGYTPNIKVFTGQYDEQKNPIYVDKQISVEDFLFNWYSSLVDGDALSQKQLEATATAIEQAKQLTLELPIATKLPALSQVEVEAAVLDAKPQTK